MSSNEIISISHNILFFFTVNRNTGEIKSFSNLKSSDLIKHKDKLIKILENFIKNEPKNTNQCYTFKKIFLSSMIIQGFFSQHFNNIFICIFNKEVKSIQRKLFFLHIFIAYKNIYLKLSKYLENNEKLFSLIFHEILLGPLIHNFDNVYKQLSKKINLVVFENSEYFSSMLIDLNTKEIICDLGNLFQKNYKISFLQFNNHKKIINELVFHGLNLKNNYIKSTDKNIDIIYNCKKIEFRTTYPKPLFIIKFIPTFEGTIIVHAFHQYKLAKIRKVDPQFPKKIVYDKYKEIDISYFNIFEEIDEDNYSQIKLIENFFFKYFLLLGNNCKDIVDNQNKVNTKIMTYKNRDYNLLYLNGEITQTLINVIKEYFKDEKDLIYKLKKKLREENDKNCYPITQETSSYKTGGKLNNSTKEKNEDNILDKNPLELSYSKFTKEFKSIELYYKLNNNDLIGLSYINTSLPEDFSNINEYSELNLTKENLKAIKRNITTKRTEENEELNIYSNNYYLVDSTERKKINSEIEEKDEIINTDEPFKSDATNIGIKFDLSKDESVIKTLLFK